MRRVVTVSLTIFFINSFAQTGDDFELRNTRFDDLCEPSLTLQSIDSDELKHIQTHGAAFYLYPEQITKSYTGCQIVWLGNGHKLVTRHYRDGKLSWLRGQEPKDIEPYFCLYNKEGLVTDRSFNLRRCPGLEE